MVPMDRTGPALATMVVPEAASDPAPRSTTPLGTVIVDETEYLPAASITTWFLPWQPFKASWIAFVASPLCAGTLAHIVVRTGNPSEPSAAPPGVSARIPGFQVVVEFGSRRPCGALLHGPPSQLCPTPVPELEPAPELDPELDPEPDPDDVAPEPEPDAEPAPEPEPAPEEDAAPEPDPEDPELDPASGPRVDPESLCDPQAAAISTPNGMGSHRCPRVLPMREVISNYRYEGLHCLSSPMSVCSINHREEPNAHGV
jgi:hypothetical protein